MDRSINIIIAETSSIVYEGLAGIFFKSGFKAQITRAMTLEEIQQSFSKKRSHLVIINPSLVQNNSKAFHALRSQLENNKWIGLVYAYYDQHLLSQFDGTIAISDSPELITSTIQKTLETNSEKQGRIENVLSDREIDILKLLTTGLANKEIADKLNISINTVITHRKNISQKTGIKSVSGLTIYAVLKKIITLENIQE